MNSYIAGTLVQINATLVTAQGVFVAPTTLTFKIQTPDGIVTDYSSTIVIEAPGAYYANFTPTQTGLHQYEWIGTGAAQAAVQGQFIVNASLF